MLPEPESWPEVPEGADVTQPSREAKTALHIKGEDDGNQEPCEWALVVYAGTQLGRVFPVLPGENILGRAPSANISLQDEEISRIHACLTLDKSQGQDIVYLDDRDSTNGTRVNGTQILARRELFAGDRIGIGSHVLKLLAMDPLERSFHKTLMDQTTKDPLTGLSNRSAILGELQSRFDLSRRHGRPLSVIMCDLDHFKNINDTYGHGGGDAVLRAFGEMVRQSLRGTDLAGRIGGEEFLLVLPETETEGAGNLAERIRSSLEDAKIPVGDLDIEVRCSLGVAERNAEDRDAGALLGRADHALYQAKRGGRNRVAFSGREKR